MKEQNKLIAAILISVVIISLITTATFTYVFNQDNEMPYQKGINGTVTITIFDDGLELGTGTGFAVNHNGIKIMTNAHVVMEDEELTYEDIRLRDIKGNECQAEVLYVDVKNDIAELLMLSENLDINALKISTSALAYGQKIFTASNARDYGISVQEGIVSIPSIIINSNGTEKLSIQTTIPLNKGSSGAPLIDEEGNIVGMMSFRMRDETGNLVQGLSYAVPSSLLREALQMA